MTIFTENLSETSEREKDLDEKMYYFIRPGRCWFGVRCSDAQCRRGHPPNHVFHIHGGNQFNLKNYIIKNNFPRGMYAVS